MEFRDLFGFAPLPSEDFSRLNKSKTITTGLELIRSAKDFELGFKLYDTPAHRGIFDILLRQATNLHNNLYVGSRGEQCSTLVGAKGIGKSTCLQSFVNMAKLLVPDVYTIYISFNNVLSSGSVFDEYSLIGLILHELGNLNPSLSVTIPSAGSKDYLLKLLVDNKLKVLLLVDELDQLYKSNRPSDVKSLADLAAIGTQPTGRITCLVCGSSAMIESLITCTGDAEVREEFPLLKLGAMNLNGTKYLTKRVYSTLPVDLSAVASILDINLEENKQYIRVLGFASGCSARPTRRMLIDSTQNGNILSGLAPDQALSGHNTLRIDHISNLRAALLERMYALNKKLLIKLYNVETGMNLFTIATVAWEEKFEPLTYQHAEEVWRHLVKAKKVPEDKAGNLTHSLLHLADRCWISIGGIVQSRPDKIYPYSMFQLLKEKIRHDAIPSSIERIGGAVSGGASEFARYIADPKVLAAAIPVAVGCTCVVS